ncbi:MAG: hypothetical protein ABSC04_06225 [Syntrophobacteraceae bacterium]
MKWIVSLLRFDAHYVTLMFVSAVIVHDHIKSLMVVFPVEMFQEAKELRMCVGIDSSSLFYQKNGTRR